MTTVVPRAVELDDGIVDSVQVVEGLWDTWLCLATVPRAVELDNGMVDSVQVVDKLWELWL